MNAIEIKSLKKYFGKTRAVDGIDFVVPKGEIFGFLGPNGAGKTTTIRCMMDFIKPTEGQISILGLDAQKNSVKLKEKIGYLSGEIKFYDSWTGQEHIDFIEKIRRVKGNSKELIKKLDFNPKMKARQLSSGNKQKLGLILALMSHPEVLILDEPTIGLDPILQNRIYEILINASKSGATVFMSSHNLAEVEKICHQVAIIKEGKLVTTESIENLKKKKMHIITIYSDQKFNEEDFRIEGVNIVEKLPEGMILKVAGNINPIIKILAKYNLSDLEISHATLEEVFLEFYQRN